MKAKHMILCAFAMALPAMSHAQAYKCQDRAGKTHISSMPCMDGKVPVTSVKREYIPPERRVEAMLAHHRRRLEAARIDAGYEAAAAAQRRYAAQGIGQPARNRSREMDKVCAEAARPHPGAQNGQLTAAQRSILASCAGGNAPATPRDYDGHGANPYQPPMPAPRPAPSSITSCDPDGGGCWDNLGNRYNKGAGTTYIPATGGGSCQMIGGQMRCP